MNNIESWRLKNERYQLKAIQPENASKIYFPPRVVEPREVAPFTFSESEPLSVMAPTILAAMGSTAA